MLREPQRERNLSALSFKRDATSKSHIMAPMKQSRGKIIIAPNLNVWPHEYETAKALAMAGMTVEFIRRSEEHRTTSADVIANGLIWEIKAPESDKAKVIEKNLRKALHQSKNVIFDARRMKKLPDMVIEREVRKWCSELRTIKHLIYVNRSGEVCIIK